MKKLLSFMGLFILVFVLASCSLFKKDEPVTTDSWEVIQTESWEKEEVKKVTFEASYESLIEKSFDNILLSYSKDLFENKFFETKTNIKAAVKHMMWEWSIELDIVGKYGREENNNPKADLTISTKWSVDSEQMQAKGDGSIELLLKVIWTKTFMNLKSFNIKSDNAEAEMIKEQIGMFMDQWILSDSSEMQIPEVTALQDFDLGWFMELLSNLIKQNPVIKEVGETTDWEYVVYDIRLDWENIYKVFEWIAKSEYAEDMNITLADVQSEREEMLKDIEEAEYEAKLKVKNISDMILELNISEDGVVLNIELWIKTNITTLDIEATENGSIMIFNVSKEWNKTNFEWKVKDENENELWKWTWSLEIVKNGNTKNINFDLNLGMMGAIIDVVANSENTEIDSLEIVEPTDAKTMEEIMAASMPEGYNPEMETPEWYENYDMELAPQDMGTEEY